MLPGCPGSSVERATILEYSTVRQNVGSKCRSNHTQGIPLIFNESKAYTSKFGVGIKRMSTGISEKMGTWIGEGVKGDPVWFMGS